jgi:putative heme-binding domain-containing protein
MRIALSLVLACLVGLAISLNVSSSESTVAVAEAKPFGIPKRVAWSTSKITGTPTAPPPYRLQRAFPKLHFDEPVEMTTAPGSKRLFLLERKGKIVSFANDDTTAKTDLFFDLSKSIDKFRAVYGIAFHPDFEKNRQVFISYVITEGDPKGTHVSRFTVNKTNPPTCDPASEEILLRWHSGGHNGACLKFGPDGYLYISAGDGAPASPPDTHRTGQDISDLLASVLRINVDRKSATKPYAVPADNPFVATKGAAPEVWAYGFRNPWKMSFDRKGALWVGDVGWEMWEMIYRVAKGGNYGWSVVESRQSVHPELPRGPTPVLPPAIDHSHIESRSITGGYTYYGKDLKELSGAYIYGDYVTGKIWALRHDGKKITFSQELADTPVRIVCFGVDPKEELLVVGYGGTLHRLVKNPSAKANKNFPKRLSQTGLFASVKQHSMAAGVIPFSINAETWSDHAIAERFIATPGTPKFCVHDKSNIQIGDVKGFWNYTPETVFAKTLSLEMEVGKPSSRRRIETQILHRDVDTWRAYTYAWNDVQTDAELVDARGLDKTFAVRAASVPGGLRKQTWHFSARTECIVCHTTRAGSIHGFNVPQLNRKHDYGGGRIDNQLRTLAHIGLFDAPAVDPKTKTLPEMVAPFDASADLTDRARSYLHINCAHCHRRGGGGTAIFELLYGFDLKKTQLVGLRPTQGTFGIHSALNVAPGDPYRSTLLYRMAKLGRGRMPHAGSGEVDVQGVKLMHDWIGSLPSGETSAITKNIRAKQSSAMAELCDGGDATKPAVDRLLASTSGALRLMFAVDSGRFTKAIREIVISFAAKHADSQVRDLFERYLPADQRIKRLGTVIKPENILALRGDAMRGRQLFLKSSGVACRNCHKIQGQGKELGPDLSHIAKKNDKVALLESMLEPSKKIDPKFVAYIVETTAGRVFSGLLARKTNDEVILKDALGKELRFAMTDIETLVPQRKSFMPELLLRDMTAEEVADLLAYLESLK